MKPGLCVVGLPQVGSLATPHNPKVAGSNPAPATNQINSLRFDGRSDKLPKTPNKEIADQALAGTGLSTISTTLLFASLFDEDIACP